MNIDTDGVITDPKLRDIARCSTCRFAVVLAGSSELECRGRPPQSNRLHEREWVRVQPSDWCASWRLDAPLDE